MNQSTTITHGLTLLSSFAIAGSIIAVWYAFQRQMCAQGPGGTCSPNIVYLGAALFAIIIAVAAFGVRKRIHNTKTT